MASAVESSKPVGVSADEEDSMHQTALLSDLAVAVPAASRVFQRLRLDYCCGGRRPLDEACRAAGLDTVTVLREIEDAAVQYPNDTRWEERPLQELIAFIVSRYHDRLRAELPDLIAMAARVEQSHHEKASCPVGLHQHLLNVHASVMDHLEKEEQILFPMILAGAGARAAAPVHMMEIEHDDHRENLARTRAMTTDLIPPAEACTTWRALYLRLQELEAELMQHIHLENNILFPRALGR